jgi:hypothetical protein
VLAECTIDLVIEIEMLPAAQRPPRNQFLDVLREAGVAVRPSLVIPVQKGVVSIAARLANAMIVEVVADVARVSLARWE